MKREVYPSILKGSVKAPGSKSIAQRFAAAALLSGGETIIRDYPDSADCQAALEVIQSLGAVVEKSGNDVFIKGGFPNNTDSKIKKPKGEIFCGESGLSSRLFTPLAALYDERICVNGSGSLLTRPFTEFDKVIPALGAECVTNNGLLPIVVTGPLKGGEAKLDGALSSQFLTGLLMSLPLAENDTVLEVSNLTSKPYVLMTMEVMKLFGVEVKHQNYERFEIRANQKYIAQEVTVPGDWSGAAFLLVAGALCSGEEGIVISNLDRNITQADNRILEALTLAGVSFVIHKDEVQVFESDIKAFDFDATECPDLVPPLVALAAFANGVSSIRGAKRLIHKESNRAKALQEEFTKANVRVVLRDDELKVYPSPIRKAILNSHNDHRIAMAATLLGLAGDKIIVAGADCVAKSFPDYFEKLKELGATITSR
jgi:3-phosphoshikimate 1-carboxyvinyltransferase